MLLCGTHDKLFDLNFITIDTNNMSVIVSDAVKLPAVQMKMLDKKITVSNFDEFRKYMEYHNSEYKKKESKLNKTNSEVK